MENKALAQQERLLPFLLNPKSYPDPAEKVRLIQTHCSFVFIADEFVYKVKKAGDFGFLDFSTLEKRRHFCGREIELNRRLTSDVYLEVLTISKTPDGFTFGKGDTVVEYAVKMRRLPEHGFLNKRLARGEARAEDLDRIAARLKDFYLAKHPADEIEEQGRIDVLRISTDENFQQIGPFIGKTVSPAAWQAMTPTTGRPYS